MSDLVTPVCNAVRKLGAMALLLSLSGVAHAADVEESPYLLGDWGGQRTALAQRGMDFDISMTNEVSHNTTGGTRQVTRAATQLAGQMTADLDRLWGIRHTTFTLTLTDRFGRNTDQDAGIGSSQQSQEIYGRGQTLWLTRMTLGRSFFDGRLDITVGRDSEGNYYDQAPCNFQNLALCGAQGPNLYGNYWMSWPGSVWMANAKLKTTQSTYISTGVFQQNPTYYDADWESSQAWKPNNPSGTNGVVLPLEFGWTPQFAGKQGHYSIGVMFNTGGMSDLIQDANGNDRAQTGLSARQTSSSYNGWISLSQRVTGQAGGEGLTLAARGIIGDKASSEYDHQIRLTAEYQGPLHRADDLAGIGLAATHTNGRQARYQRMYNALHPDAAEAVGDGNEYTVEMYYRWHVLKSVYLQPDLQYVVHPGGSRQNPNAFFLGLRSGISF